MTARAAEDKPHQRVADRAKAPADFADSAPFGSCGEGERAVWNLLSAYDSVLRVVDAQRIVAVPQGARGTARLRRLRAIRPLIRYVVVYHASRRLQMIGQAYSARVALAPNLDSSHQGRQRVESFQQSLPPVPTKRIAFFAVLAALLVTQALLPFVESDFLGKPLEGARTSGAQLIDEFTTAFLTLQPAELRDSLEAVARQDRLSIIVVFLVLIIAFRLTAHPWIKAFRAKRLLFEPRVSEHFRIQEKAVSEDLSEMVDVYQLEAQAFDCLGVRGRREFPFDLAVGVVVLVVPIVFGLGFLSLAIRPTTPDDVAFGLMFAALFLAPSAGRLVQLMRAWRTRLALSSSDRT